jgi:hypothetical protein
MNPPWIYDKLQEWRLLDAETHVLSMRWLWCPQSNEGFHSWYYSSPFRLWPKIIPEQTFPMNNSIIDRYTWQDIESYREGDTIDIVWSRAKNNSICIPTSFVTNHNSLNSFSWMTSNYSFESWPFHIALIIVVLAL